MKSREPSKRDARKWIEWIATALSNEVLILSSLHEHTAINHQYERTSDVKWQNMKKKKRQEKKYKTSEKRKSRNKMEGANWM